jgi:hypothetical protein
MITLKQSLSSWGSETFERDFCTEVASLPAGLLPLEQGLVLSSAVADEPFRVMVIRAEESADGLQLKAGVFYSGIIAGCSCADDPTPQVLQQEYCELEFLIDSETAQATVRLLADE